MFMTGTWSGFANFCTTGTMHALPSHAQLGRSQLAPMNESLLNTCVLRLPRQHVGCRIRAAGSGGEGTEWKACMHHRAPLCCGSLSA
ncbi:hypothetical protein T484DRAFT_1976617 [Baffinella frigidus]|nr:hypothetical protein T484DRAFT_1976617 [Cryptophyta sp. CCMP2293]